MFPKTFNYDIFFDCFQNIQKQLFEKLHETNWKMRVEVYIKFHEIAIGWDLVMFQNQVKFLNTLSHKHDRSPTDCKIIM